jgi:hypothetical protein
MCDEQCKMHYLRRYVDTLPVGGSRRLTVLTVIQAQSYHYAKPLITHNSSLITPIPGFVSDSN